MIAVIDGHYLLHRQLRQPEIADLRNSEDLPLGGVFGFVKSLRHIIGKHRGIQQCVVVFDGGHSERRKELYPEYKHRDFSDAAELDALGWTYQDRYDYQIEVLHDLLPVLGCRLLQLRGKEGDDVIWRITDLGPDALYLIVSDDRDMMLLVNDKVHLYRPMADQYITLRNYILHKPFVPTPDHYLMWKSCAGKKNEVPGVKGVGEKTLAQVVPDVLTFGELREAAKVHIDKRVRKIAECFDKVELSRDLADITLEEFTVAQDRVIRHVLESPACMDPSATLHQFGWMEFHSLIEDFEMWIPAFQRLR
jgi:DNA polymerase-1